MVEPADDASEQPVPCKVEAVVFPPTPEHQLLGKVDPNNIYTSDVHPVLRQRSRALKDLPPLEPAGDAGKPVLPAH
ncbi:hypothetical protein MNEG_4571 [Monoraphidium neglectum]|uniref:Uncharacterized protein n=1 Tax=Monoraphidium neglectum TaxID=145388 RepID=A0A0D2JXM2_9CHLO|nr:hypothetical protein MNEG_4571 [Monoraphidium neglectum]KIZ03388.1 hypothetical protein MNEG_4571 [Monoraphidium neglectum]|eukprot:XP_013902407.1 hypothetical protein MNEG_4571 [Monoraphidium neglectum]